MRQRALKGLWGLLVLLLAPGAIPAKADDYYPFNSWSGIYVGALASYAWHRVDVSQTAVPAVIPPGAVAPVVTPCGTVGAPLPASVACVPSGNFSTNMDGFGVTGLVGYRMPVLGQRLVLGAEFDGAFGDNRGTTELYRYTADWFVSGRGMLGWRFHPSLMLFATGGIGVLGPSTESSGQRTNTVGAGTFVDIRQSKTLGGISFGTGLEWETGHGFNVRGDYLHTSYTGWHMGTVVSNRDVSIASDTLRLGIIFSLYNTYDDPHYRGPYEPREHDR
jgi:opacity protein-like surface antigen